MTFKEQLIKDYPWLYAENVAETIELKCPSELGFVGSKEMNAICEEVNGDCTKCWNR